MPAGPGAVSFEPGARRLIAWFESLTPASLAQLGELYTEDAFFKDPFNEVRWPPAIRLIFEHMFASLDEPRFMVTEAVVDGDRAFLAWEFVFRMRRFDRAPQRIRGGSHLHFAPDGRVCMHRDYWDAAEELYEKLPVLGTLMRWLKRRAAR